MKKLLIASYNMNLGGIEKACIELLKNFDYTNYEVTLLLQEKKGVLLNQIPKDVKIKEYRISKSKNVIFRKIANRFKLWFYILKNYHYYDMAICYATYDIPSSILTRYIANRSVLWVHSNYVQAYQDEKQIRSFFDKRKISKFHDIVFVSKEARSDLIPYYPSIVNCSRVINNFVNFSEIEQLSKTSIPIEKLKTTLLFVGRLEETSKGLSRLLTVMKDFQNEQKKIDLWIVGDGPSRTVYESFIKSEKIKNVVFMGMQKNPYPYMKQADLFVLPSNYEGFPVVCLEALSLKLKIVTTIDVSTDDFHLSDYVWICERTSASLKQTIEIALKERPKKKFDGFKLNDMTKHKISELLGEKDEI